MAKTILCLCRDVTVDDVRRAVAEGYDDLETLKRFTGACTGPCQGKTCLESIRTAGRGPHRRARRRGAGARRAGRR